MRAAQINTILLALCHSVAGMIPCNILKFFICSIFPSTWIRTAAIRLDYSSGADAYQKLECVM